MAMIDTLSVHQDIKVERALHSTSASTAYVIRMGRDHNVRLSRNEALQLANSLLELIGEVDRDDKELALLAKTVSDLEDCGETETPQAMLLRWAGMSLLDADHFSVTEKCREVLAASGREA